MKEVEARLKIWKSLKKAGCDVINIFFFVTPILGNGATTFIITTLSLIMDFIETLSINDSQHDGTRHKN
jgi:hypothetical protein